MLSFSASVTVQAPYNSYYACGRHDLEVKPRAVLVGYVLHKAHDPGAGGVRWPSQPLLPVWLADNRPATDAAPGQVTTGLRKPGNMEVHLVNAAIILYPS